LKALWSANTGLKTSFTLTRRSNILRG
jgi:hypothetical protein